MTVRARLDSETRRAQLVELGLRLFSSRSYDELSIDDIAREAGIAKGLLYHYFGGKRAFYVAVVRDAAARLLAATQPDRSVRGPLRAMTGLVAYLEFVSERREAFTALMRGGLGNDPELSEVIESTRLAFVDHVLDGLGLTEPRPAFRTAARAWIGAVEGASLDWLSRPELPRDDLARMLLVGLGGMLVMASRLDPDAPLDPDVVVLADLLALLA